MDGEPTELERELDRSCHQTQTPTATDEEERLELLEAIATQMRAYASLRERTPMDPALVLCLDLLLHLAKTAPAVPARKRRTVAPKAEEGRPNALHAGVYRVGFAVTPRN